MTESQAEQATTRAPVLRSVANAIEPLFPDGADLLRGIARELGQTHVRTPNPRRPAVTDTPEIRRMLAHTIRDTGDLPMDRALKVAAAVEEFLTGYGILLRPQPQAQVGADT